MHALYSGRLLNAEIYTLSDFLRVNQLHNGKALVQFKVKSNLKLGPRDR